MFPSFFQVRIDRADGLRVAVTREFRHLGDRDARLKGVGHVRVAERVADDALELQLGPEPPEPTADRVAIPGLAVGVQEQDARLLLRTSPRRSSRRVSFR